MLHFTCPYDTSMIQNRHYNDIARRGRQAGRHIVHKTYPQKDRRLANTRCNGIWKMILIAIGYFRQLAKQRFQECVEECLCVCVWRCVCVWERERERERRERMREKGGERDFERLRFVSPVRNQSAVMRRPSSTTYWVLGTDTIKPGPDPYKTILA